VLQSLREVIDLAVEDSRSLLRGRPVEIRLADDQQRFSMDSELIRRVLRHLIENAAKYSPPGTPIELTNEVREERLLVHVTDRGLGIPEAERELIFDKFYRSKPLKWKVQGTGMGLAIVKAILAVHGGGISVTSKPPLGSTFTFWIPIVEKAQ
jgi:two-component system sensor histidine kinase KdpD